MKVLSVDGGGYLGLATAAFIEEAERHSGKKFHETFDLFCGTSTGAIIALALACGMSGQEIRALYEDFGPKIFPSYFPGHRYFRMGKALIFGAMYPNDTLHGSLGNAFGQKTLGDLQANGRKVIVTAFCLTSGFPRVFKTNHGPGLTKQSRILLRDIAMASAAAPSYLPIVEVTDPETGLLEQFCDGGVFANHPGLLGYTEALSHCGANPADIKVLSLSTPRASLAEHKSAKRLMGTSLNRSALAWTVMGNLPSIFVDGTSAITNEALKRLLGAQYDRVAFDKPKGTDMDIATAKATQTLRQLGHDVASGADMRSRIAKFLN